MMRVWILMLSSMIALIQIYIYTCVKPCIKCTLVEQSEISSVNSECDFVQQVRAEEQPMHWTPSKESSSNNSCDSRGSAADKPNLERELMFGVEARAGAQVFERKWLKLEWDRNWCAKPRARAHVWSRNASKPSVLSESGCERQGEREHFRSARTPEAPEAHPEVPEVNDIRCRCSGFAAARPKLPKLPTKALNTYIIYIYTLFYNLTFDTWNWCPSFGSTLGCSKPQKWDTKHIITGMGYHSVELRCYVISGPKLYTVLCDFIILVTDIAKQHLNPIFRPRVPKTCFRSGALQNKSGTWFVASKLFVEMCKTIVHQIISIFCFFGIWVSSVANPSG